MPLTAGIKKVLVLGSGPIVIGQAAEFDYAGTQACRALKEEGLEVVLVNSNPATIMTDKDIADHVYIEPLNIASVTQVIEKERPDSILPTLGGQVGLNLAMALHESGVLEKYGVRLLGTSPESIHKAEDRQGFKDCMESINQPCVTSLVVESVRLLRQDGTVTVTYAAFDSARNVSKKTREVLYSDYESPRFALKQPLMFSQKNYDLLSLITARDMLDGDITGRIRATALDEISSDFQGTYKVRFQVTNSLGDTVDLVLPVDVYTPGVNEVAMTLTEYLIYLESGDRFNARDYLDELTVGRDIIPLGKNLPDTMKLTVSGKVETGVPGIYVINYHLAYCPVPQRPEQTYNAYSRLIVVVEG